MKFELAPLPYAYEALDPHISARTLHFHYDKHHRGYLEKLKQAIGDKPAAEKSLLEIIRTSEGKVFNLAAQLWNHSFYWDCMTPDGGGKPEGKLRSAIERDFGSFADFQRQLAEVANGQFGSGWGWLVLTPTRRLQVLSTSDADNPLRTQSTALLTVDVWEHAYYLDYQNERQRYVQGFIDHLINWKFVAENFSRAGG